LKLFIYFDKPKYILKKTPDKHMLESSSEDWLKPNKETKHPEKRLRVCLAAWLRVLFK